MQILCGAGLDNAVDISPLVETLRSKDAVARRRAREQLVMAGRVAVRPLLELLHDHKPHVRWEAAKALASIGDPKTASALAEVVEEDDEFDVRWVAGEGLIAMGPEGLRALLGALARRPSSATLQEGAHHVCHHLSKRRMFAQIVAPVLA
ncbi:MAG: HEAT repeat domain-containing protein, partial [Thermoguttaceae bacterium]